MDREDWQTFKENKNHETVRRFRRYLSCEKCQSSGICNVVNKKTNEEYFVRCNCEYGKESFRSEIPMLTKDMLEEFEPKRIIALDWKPTKENSYDMLVAKWKERINKSKSFFDDPANWGVL